MKLGGKKRLTDYSPVCQSVASLLVVALLTFVSTATAGSEIARGVVSSGGTEGGNDELRLLGTVCQTATGDGTAGGFSMQHGFWQPAVVSICCLGITGSVQVRPACDQSNQTVDISDLTNLIDHLFISYAGLCCPEEADIAPAIDGGVPDGAADVSDLTALIDHLFITYPALPACP